MSLPVGTPPVNHTVPQKRQQSITECLLCYKEADVKLKPCGHVVICRICSERAKKCPECKVRHCIVFFNYTDYCWNVTVHSCTCNHYCKNISTCETITFESVTN